MNCRVFHIAFVITSLSPWTALAQAGTAWETLYSHDSSTAVEATAFDSVPPPAPGLPASDLSAVAPLSDPPQPSVPAQPITSLSPTVSPPPRVSPRPSPQPPSEPEPRWRFTTPVMPKLRWEFAADALWLERSINSVPLGYTTYNNHSPVYPTQPSLGLYSDDYRFPLETGVRLRLNVQIDERRSFEGIFWGLQQWSTSDVIYGDPQYNSVLAYSSWLQMPWLIGGMNDYLGYTYKSQVNNAEINGQLELQSYHAYASYLKTSWLWGMRYMHLSEDLTVRGSDLETGFSYAERLDSRTTNDLVGLQTGLRFTRDWDRLQVISEGKVGLLANSYTQRGSDSAEGTGSPYGFGAYEVSHSGTDLSALVELSIAARLRLGESLWLRLGYQFYFVSGIATAPRQLGGFDHNASVLLDGLSLGLEATW
jgi:hypothetical protein